MATPKRILSPVEGGLPETKRARISDTFTESSDDYRVSHHVNSTNLTPVIWNGPNLHSQSRQSIQRSIAMVLQHDGFDSATPQALECFTQIVEEYLDSIIGEIKQFAHSSRREHPTPMDFEKTLNRHNIPIRSLKPHLNNPLPRQRLAPTYIQVKSIDDHDAFTTLPLLDPELSGQADKDSKSYIPKSFPDFPSMHTYKFTLQEDINIRDSKRIREQAARTAQQGEDALRRLVRASKMRKQKEVKSLVERDGHGKERFRLWELTMKRFMGVDSRGENTDQVDISDHSMIVNSDAVYNRKEVSRLGKRSSA